MRVDELVFRLSGEIYSSLTKIVKADYWLLEVPHYANVGDTLIWQGEMDFLKTRPYKCKGMASFDSRRLPNIGPYDLVLFQGGGNFGDLWCDPHEYRKRIMESNPTCRFVVFPQTVWYGSFENLKADAEFFSNFDCTICARDKVSFALLEKHFKNKILLVPDMAFCMDMSKWRKKYLACRPLVLKRDDKELRMSDEFKDMVSSLDADICDWPTMTQITRIERWRDEICCHPRKLGWLYEPYMYHVYRPYLIRSGVNLISSHTDIYTTRLHACILSLLLGKENIVLFDNSYGKNRNFYDTWLKDCDSVKIM